MHRGEVFGRADPRLSDSHVRSSSLGASAALAGRGGRGAAGSPQATLALNRRFLGDRRAKALFTRLQSSGAAKSQASQEG